MERAGKQMMHQLKLLAKLMEARKVKKLQQLDKLLDKELVVHRLRHRQCQDHRLAIEHRDHQMLVILQVLQRAQAARKDQVNLLK